MDAITYENGTSSVPWLYPLHGQKPRGCAYETDTHFVHMYAEDRSPWGINIGQTVTQAKSGLLADWVTNTFGAQHQEPMDMPVGTVITGVWRPGLYYETDVFQALQTDRIERRSAEQALHQLVERLTDLLLYVEPEGAGLDSYGPKGRELLILAATEAENAWASYMQLGNVGVVSRPSRPTLHSSVFASASRPCTSSPRPSRR